MDLKEIEKEVNRQAAIDCFKILLIGAVITAGLIFGLIAAGNCSIHKSERELIEKVHSYNTITVNGEVFETSEVVNIDIQVNYYANDTMIFSMSDGTEIAAPEGSWTLKK